MYMPPGNVSGGFQELLWAVYESTFRTPHNQPTIANRVSLCLLSKSLHVSVSIVTYASEMLLKVREQCKGAIERDEKSGSKHRSIEYILAGALMAPVGAMGKVEENWQEITKLRIDPDRISSGTREREQYAGM